MRRLDEVALGGGWLGGVVHGAGRERVRRYEGRQSFQPDCHVRWDRHSATRLLAHRALGAVQ